MHKLVIFSLIALCQPLRPAAEAKKDDPMPFQVISERMHPVTSLEEPYRKAWVNAYTAIDENNYDHFAAEPTSQLVNKVSHIAPKSHAAASIVHVMTLLEYLTEQESTENRTKMINLLLYHGAHTRSTYGIGHDCHYQDHLPPIYYAIIFGNIGAFEALVKKDNKVPMQSAIDIWGRDDSAPEEASIGLFLKRLTHLKRETSLPDSRILAYMQTLNDRAKDANASCVVG